MTAINKETKGFPFPILQGVLPIKGAEVPSEIIAGITLAALAIPEVMGYTKIAGVDSAGGHSQLAQTTTTLIVLLVLLFLTRVLAYMPAAVLSAVVFLIGVELIDIKGMKKIFVERRSEFWVALITAGVVAFPRALEWAEQHESSRIHLDAVLMRNLDASAFRLTSGKVWHSESVFTFLAENGGWIPALLLFLVLSLPLLNLVRFDRLPVRERVLTAWAALYLIAFLSIPFLWLAPLGLLFFLIYVHLLNQLGRSDAEGSR